MIDHVASSGRKPALVWRPLLDALREDLAGQNAFLLALMGTTLGRELREGPSHVRMIDIAIWMGEHR